MHLRDVTEDDLSIFLEQQREPGANRMARVGDPMTGHDGVEELLMERR